MKTLIERFADRANRKAENAAESTALNAVGIGAVVSAAMAVQDSMNGLSAVNRDEVSRILSETYGDTFNSIAEDENGNDRFAGIGVPNPLIIPAQAREAEAAEAVAGANMAADAMAGNGGGWGAGNANGRAVEAQAGDSANAGAPVETDAERKAREDADKATAAARGKGTTTVVPKAKA